MNSFYHRNHRASAHLSSISSLIFKWLPSESWDKEHEQFYLKLRCKDYSPFLYLPAYPNKKIATKSELLNRWILTDFDENKYLWCDCHLIKSHYNLISIYMSSSKTPPQFLGEAFSLFISSQILSNRADLIQVIPASGEAYRQLQVTHKGIEPKEVWTPHPYFLFNKSSDPPGIKHKIWSFSPGEWWVDPQRAEAKSKLGYIEKRLKRLERSQLIEPRKAHKGLSALLQILGRRKKKDQHRSADL